MTPYKQLHLHRPAQGQIGDCWRTAIGCLLDLPPERVPHFVEPDFSDAQGCRERTLAWLGERGLTYVEFAFQGDLHQVMTMMAGVNPGTYYLVGGNSGNHVGHTVVACDDQIVWDTAIDNSGIVGPMDDGLYWLTLLVPLQLVKRELQPPHPTRTGCTCLTPAGPDYCPEHAA